MATVSVTVTEPAQPSIVGVDDHATTEQGVAVVVDVLANDTPTGAKVIASVTQPASGQGSVEITSDQKLRFTPAPSFVGQASFSYEPAWPSTPIPSPGVQAAMADALVASVGVNTHFTRAAYKSNYTAGINLRQKLSELGARHVRDGVDTNDATFTSTLNDLYATLGIRPLLICNTQSNQTPNAAYSWLDGSVGFAKLAGMEGLNEPAVFHGGNAQADAYSVQTQLWDRFRVNGSAAAKALPIYGPSPTSIEEADAHRIYAQLQGRPYDTIADHANIHPYPNGRHPETTGWGGKDPEGAYNYGALPYNMQGIGESVMHAPIEMAATENGYRHVFPYAGGQRSVPDDVGAIYQTRMALYTFAYRLPSGSRVHRNYLYILWDDENQGFGLVRQDGTNRPEFTALSNLIFHLADPGPDFTPGGLDYQLSGSLNDVKTALFQKRDGTFYLALWIGRSLWNPDNAVAESVNPQSVTVVFPASAGAVSRNYPTDDRNWNGLPKSGNTVSVSVEAKPQLLRIA